MQDLIELIGLVQKTKFKANGLLDVIVEPDTQMGQLYNAIWQKKVLTNEDVKTVFPELGRDSAKLATVKSKLKERLSDSVFLLGFKESGYADRQRAFLECTRKWASAMILMTKQARLNGIGQLETLLRHSEFFEFTELSLDILRVLRLHYGLVEGDEKRFSHCEALLRKYEQLWAAECQVESLYADLVVRYVNSKADKNAVAAKAAEYHARTSELCAQFNSFKVQLFGRLIETILHDSRNDFGAMARTCEDALHFFEVEKEYQSGLSLQLFYYNLIVCYLHTKQFDKGRQLLGKFESFLEEGSFNWFKVKELSFFMDMHAGHYGAAFATYQQVLDDPRYEQLPAPVLELWKIFEAYLYYLVQIGKIHVDWNRPERYQLKFRINRFLNEVQVFAKDKKGMNIPVLIIQFLYALAEGKYESCEERVESLNKYRTRYLNDPETLRSNYFIKLLALIPAAGFHTEQARLKSRKIYELLLHTPWESVNANHEVEIIPYENLWTLVLDGLKGRDRKTVAAGAWPSLAKTG